MRLLALALALLSAFSLIVATGSASAAPLSAPATLAAAEARTGGGLLIRVHGRHRACERGPVYRWDTRARHRHIGRRVEVCGRRHRGRGRPADWRRRGCFAIGPVWYCP